MLPEKKKQKNKNWKENPNSDQNRLNCNEAWHNKEESKQLTESTTIPYYLKKPAVYIHNNLKIKLHL